MTAIAHLSKDRPLLLVGGGNMGGALARGWLAAGLDAAALWVVEPRGGQAVPFVPAEQVVPAAEALPAALAPALIVLAVKPQVMAGVLAPLRPLVDGGAGVLSIAAGIRAATLQAGLGGDARIVRAMPNTPAAVGEGVSVAVPSGPVGEDDRALADALLAAAGAVVWVADEALLDGVTAVSGSGPAYVFHLVEALAAAGIGAGLPEALATELAERTVLGAAALMKQSGQSAQDLRRQVTSPQGTTAAALDVLMGEDGLTRLMTRAVRAAADRSRALSG